MTTLLEMRGATRRFGGLLAVNGLDLAVSSGESVGLIGPNGAGKTTAFGILMGDVRPNTGSVRFRGEDVTRLPTHARITRGMARTHQVPRPFGEMSVRDNVRVGLMPDSIRRLLLEAGDPEREREVLAAVGFAAREVAMLPGQLSMGELRKLELARALATGPELLLLDEVFAGLTVGEIAQLTELLQARRRDGLTLVIVSHDLRSLAPLVDRVVVMAFGEAIFRGGFDAAMADPGVREAYLGEA